MTSTVASELRGMLTALALAVSTLLVAASVNLGLPAEDGLHSVRFHLAAFALLIPLLMLGLGIRWRAVGILLLITVSLGHGAWIILDQQGLRDPTPHAGQALTLLSFNVLAESEQGQNVAEFIEELAPDLAVIMETPGLERALGRLEQTLPYRVGCDRTDACDLSLLSQTPFSSVSVHKLGPLGRERFITATTTIGDQSITVAALHLSKPYFDRASIAELWQVSHILEGIEGPLIVAGDFNAAPWSANVARFIRRNGLVPGPSYPATWPVRLGGLGLPIDAVFTRGQLQIETIAATEENFGSNHRGLVAHIRGLASP